MNDDCVGCCLLIIYWIIDEENGFFQCQYLDLEFFNGECCCFECLVSCGYGVVVVVLMFDDEIVLLVCEYVVGMYCYELGLVKGRIDVGEIFEQVVDCELKEEVGYGVCWVDVLCVMILVLIYMSYQLWLVVVCDLYLEKLVGDELEELEVVLWKLVELDQLMLCEDFFEGCLLVVLFIVCQWLQGM